MIYSVIAILIRFDLPNGGFKFHEPFIQQNIPKNIKALTDGTGNNDKQKMCFMWKRT